jgi:hypothetical protein
VAAVIEGRTVFAEELPWDPKGEPDPGYHLGHIEAALKKAASFLRRVDAIGGSAAGIYIDNRVKAATLFRAVPADVFAATVEPMFVRLGERWGVPLTVINDETATWRRSPAPSRSTSTAFWALLWGPARPPPISTPRATSRAGSTSSASRRST